MNLRTLPPLSKTELAGVERPEMASQSFLAKWNTCHRSAFLYLKHRGGPQSHAMARGEAFHEFVEKAAGMLVAAGEESMPPEVAKAEMNAVIEERRDLVIPEHEKNALRAMAWNWANATIVDPDSIVGLEQMIELEIGEWTIRGKLDFAEIHHAFRRALVRDYKTSLYVPSQDEIEFGVKSYQGRFYALLMLFGTPEGEELPLGQGLDECIVELSYPRFVNTETGALVGREVTWERDQLADFRHALEIDLEQIDQALEDGFWPASPGSHCYECPAREECPLPEQYLPLKVESQEHAEQLAALHFTRDAQQRELKAALRAFHGQSGTPIYFGDYALDTRYQESRDWKKAQLTGGLINPASVPIKTATIFDKRKITPQERDERDA